jgi:hypothetical protein
MAKRSELPPVLDGSGDVSDQNLAAFRLRAEPSGDVDYGADGTDGTRRCGVQKNWRNVCPLLANLPY